MDGKEIGESPVTPENLGKLIQLVVSGELSGKLAKEVNVREAGTGVTADMKKQLAVVHNTLGLVELKRKNESVANAQKSWDEDFARNAKLDPDDWRVALVKNDAAMRKLLQLYASKVKGK